MHQLSEGEQDAGDDDARDGDDDGEDSKIVAANDASNGVGARGAGASVACADGNAIGEA